MIGIRNTQRKIKLDIPRITATVETVLRLLEYEQFDVGIWFTTNATIRNYNNNYRHKDKPTDILSFPYHHTAKPGKRIVAHSADDYNLGDIIISPEYVHKVAADDNIPFEQHLTRVLVHGICHLLGYDHIKNNDFKLMDTLEQKILVALKK